VEGVRKEGGIESPSSSLAQKRPGVKESYKAIE
jgi:hypothetical protein